MPDIFDALETATAGKLNGWVQAGTVDVDFVSQARAEATITFDHEFVSNPVVVLTVRNDADSPIFVGQLQDVTTTGCVVRAGRSDGSTVTVTVPVQWVAVGEPDLSP